MKFFLPLNLICICCISLMQAQNAYSITDVDTATNWDSIDGIDAAVGFDTAPDNDDFVTDFDPAVNASALYSYREPRRVRKRSTCPSPVYTCQRRVKHRCQAEPICAQIACTNICRYFSNDCMRQHLNCQRLADAFPLFLPAPLNRCLGITAGNLAPCER